MNDDDTLYKNIINKFEKLLLKNKEIKILCIIIIVLFTYIFTYVYSLKLSTIFGIIISFIIVYYIFYYSEYKKEFLFTNTKNKIEYLDSIMNQNIKQKTSIGLRQNTTYIPGSEPSNYIDSYFYIDINIVNLLYSVRDYEIYSPDVFKKILYLTNTILKLYYDINLVNEKGEIVLENCNNNYITTKRFVKLAVNYFHSMIYSIPVNTYYETKYKNSLYRFRLLLQRKLNDIKNICIRQNKNNPININTVFISPFDTPKPYDDQDDKPFNFFV